MIIFQLKDETIRKDAKVRAGVRQFSHGLTIRLYLLIRGVAPCWVIRKNAGS